MDRFTTDDGDSILTLAQWRQQTGLDAHSFVATPTQLFVDARHNDYRLSPSSPAIDHGTTLADVPTDIAGVARELRSRVDVWLVSGIDAPRGATVDEVAAQVAQALQIAEPHAGDASEVAVHTIRKFRNPSEAYAYACEQAARNDRICVFGSFHTVAEVLKNMVERR